MNKAFTSLTVKSAFKKAGIVPFNVNAILSKNNHYRKLSKIDSKFLQNCIPELARIFTIKDFIPEEDFSRILGQRDNHIPTTGKPLNFMATNRQRSVGLSQNLLEHQANVVEILNNNKRKLGSVGAEDTASKKAKRIRKCANPTCLRPIPESDNIGLNMRVESSNSDGILVDGRTWTRCDAKRCLLIFCPNDKCQRCCYNHRRVHV